MRQFLFIVMAAGSITLYGQKMTLEEYNMVKEFRIDNLDEDTYIKISPEYVLDRYNMQPPYYIAGEKDSKNRVDLYKVIKRGDMTELGLLMIYSNSSTGKISHLILPFQAEKEVWTQYYDDLKYGGQDDPALSFAIGSVLSKELSNILITGITGEGYEVESSDYDICFPSGSSILMQGGAVVNIENIRMGDQVLSESKNGSLIVSTVTAIERHAANTELVKIIAIPSSIETASDELRVLPKVQLLATPNHPVITNSGSKPVWSLSSEDLIRGVIGEKTKDLKVQYVSISGREKVVYNLKTEHGNYFVNGILVSDK